jgi:hypothetical protein
MNTRSASLLCALSLAVTANFCEATPVVITAGGQTYSQDFDTLTTSTTSQHHHLLLQLLLGAGLVLFGLKKRQRLSLRL